MSAGVFVSIKLRTGKGKIPVPVLISLFRRLIKFYFLPLTLSLIRFI